MQAPCQPPHRLLAFYTACLRPACARRMHSAALDHWDRRTWHFRACLKGLIACLRLARARRRRSWPHALPNSTLLQQAAAVLQDQRSFGWLLESIGVTRTALAGCRSESRRWWPSQSSPGRQLFSSSRAQCCTIAVLDMQCAIYACWLFTDSLLSFPAGPVLVDGTSQRTVHSGCSPSQQRLGDVS